MGIQNIVFDLGNVLVDFDPAAYLCQLGYPKEKAAYLEEIIFNDAWPKGDRGDYLSLEEMRAALLQEHPEETENIKRVLKEDCVKMHVLRADVCNVLSEMKTRGFQIFLLSNLAKYSFDFISGYPFFKSLDGGVFSYQEQVCKPDERIYRILLERYHLLPQETIFLDDNAENIATAKRLGIHAVHFKTLTEAKTEMESIISQFHQ